MEDLYSIIYNEFNGTASVSLATVEFFYTLKLLEGENFKVLGILMASEEMGDGNKASFHSHWIRNNHAKYIKELKDLEMRINDCIMAIGIELESGGRIEYDIGCLCIKNFYNQFKLKEFALDMLKMNGYYCAEQIIDISQETPSELMIESLFAMPSHTHKSVLEKILFSHRSRIPNLWGL